MGKKSIFTLTLITAGLLSAQSLQEVQSAVNDFSAAAAYNNTGSNEQKLVLTVAYSANRLPGARGCSATMVIARTAFQDNAFVSSTQWEIDLDQMGKRITARLAGNLLTITLPAGGIKAKETSQTGAGGAPRVSQVSSLTFGGPGYAAKSAELALKAMAPNQAAIRYCQSQAG